MLRTKRSTRTKTLSLLNEVCERQGKCKKKVLGLARIVEYATAR